MRPTINPTSRQKTSFVYVISDAHGCCKIGRSGRPTRRLSTLRGAHSGKLTIEATCAVSASDVAAVEARAHEILKPFRVRGEWFRVTVPFAKLAVRFAAGDGVSGDLFNAVRAFIEAERTPNPVQGEGRMASVVERCDRLQAMALEIENAAPGLLLSLEPWHGLYLPTSMGGTSCASS